MRRSDSNRRPLGYEPSKIPLLHVAIGLRNRTPSVSELRWSVQLTVILGSQQPKDCLLVLRPDIIEQDEGDSGIAFLLHRFVIKPPDKILLITKINN